MGETPYAIRGFPDCYLDCQSFLQNHGDIVLREADRYEIDPYDQEQRIVEFYAR
jgi:hypothetical protein